MSTIDPLLPVSGLPYNAAPIRENFGAAIADIDALQSLNAGDSAPADPVLGTLWLDSSAGTTYTLRIWNDRQSQWVPIADLDSLNSLWVPPVGGGLPVSLLADDTTDLGSVPQTVETITGSGPIYSFGTSAPAGIVKVLTFDGTTQIIYNATSMILPGLADLTTDAGSMGIAVALGSGNWQILYYQTNTLLPAQGGTGRTSLTAHSVLLGEGTDPVNFAVPGTTGYSLLSTGPSSDPAFGQVNLTAGITGILPVANGGTGLTAITAHNLMVGNGAGVVATLAPGTLGFPLISRGPSLDPIYQPLNLAGPGVSGILPPANLPPVAAPFTKFNATLITVSGTYTIPAAHLTLKLVGGGGGGEGGTGDPGNPIGGGGGGSGAYILYPLSGLTVGSTLTVVIGAAGVGGAGSGAPGTNAEATVVSSGTATITTATAGGGGGGGIPTAGLRGPGGAPSGGIVGQSVSFIGADGVSGFSVPASTGLAGGGGVISTGLGTFGAGGAGGPSDTVSNGDGMDGMPGAILVEWLSQ